MSDRPPQRASSSTIHPLLQLLAFITLILCLLQSASVQAAPGDLDSTFGEDGVVSITVNERDDPNTKLFAEFGDAIVQPDGKTIVVGEVNTVTNSFDENFLVARLQVDGTLDPTFGVGGIVTTDFRTVMGIGEGSHHDGAFAVALMQDGRIVVAGHSFAGPIPPNNSYRQGDFAVARYLPDGTLDPSFSGDGVVTTDVSALLGLNGDSSDAAEAVAVMDDGGVIVGGTVNESSPDFAVVRYLADGTPDPSFGTGGAVMTDIRTFMGSPGDRDEVNHMALMADGRVVMVGTVEVTTSGRTDVAIVRYQADGTLDPTFGGDGVVTTDVLTATGGGTDSAEVAVGVTVMADGRIVAVGLVNDVIADTWGDFLVLRYLPDGSLDSSWDGDGVVMTDIGPYAGQDPGTTDVAYSVVLTGDGRVLVAGHANSGEVNVAVVRYLPDGSLDPTFGGDGVISTDLSGMVADQDAEQEHSRAIALLPDGRFVVGASLRFEEREIALVRYQGNAASPSEIFLPTLDR